MATTTNIRPGEQERAILARIVDKLVADVVRDRARCTWLGRDANEMTDLRGPLVPTVRTLEADLYSGLSGVALFLGEAARSGFSSAVANELARVAIASASELVTSSGGVFSGLAGLAYAEFRLGQLWDDETLVASSIERFDRAVTLACERDELDVISGLAGIALFASDLPGCEAVARRAASEILSRARWTDDRADWRPVALKGSVSRHFWNGFSHGRSGMAAALLRTRHLFNDDRALVAARAALHTEAAWFVPELENWPDLRNFDGDKLPDDSSERAALTCGTTWCHGAPGVLLARAELARVEGNGLDRLGHAALTTTLREIAKWRPGADVTPCHGVLGLLEIIDVVRDVLTDELASTSSAVVRRTRKKVIAAYARDSDWPTGVPSGKYTPSLMVGHAGVGHHFLRVLDPRRPSLLYPEHR